MPLSTRAVACCLQLTSLGEGAIVAMHLATQLCCTAGLPPAMLNTHLRGLTKVGAAVKPLEYAQVPTGALLAALPSPSPRVDERWRLQFKLVINGGWWAVCEAMPLPCLLGPSRGA